MKNLKLIIAGSMPPPIGGVTIHILRLTDMLRSQDIRYTFFDLRPKKRKKISLIVYLVNFFRIITSSKKNIIHYQLNNWFEAAILSFFCKLFRKKIIYTVHSFTYKLDSISIIKKLAIIVVRKNVEIFIAPSETIKRLLIQNSFSEKKIEVMDTFLPPSKKELNQNVPSEILSFVSTKDKIILANASNLYLNKNGIDVYGLDMCIQACSRIKGVKFLYCIPKISDRVYYQKCLAEIKRLGIEDRFLIYNKEVSLVSLFKYCNLFVRPTVSDSFGISVAEALICNVPAIASNVCERAEGTLLFESRNVDDFILKINERLDCSVNYEYNRKDLFYDYLRIYEKCEF